MLMVVMLSHCNDQSTGGYVCGRAEPPSCSGDRMEVGKHPGEAGPA